MFSYNLAKNKKGIPIKQNAILTITFLVVVINNYLEKFEFTMGNN